MKQKLLQKLIGCIATAFIFAGIANAQAVDTVNFLPDGGITGKQIVYFKVQLGEEAETINAGIALSEPEIVAWADYSAFLRWYNVNKEPYIDARNGAAFEVNEMLTFEFGMTYHCWLDVDFEALTYSAWVMPENETTLYNIITDAVFRNANVSALTLYSIIYHPDESQVRLELLDMKYTDLVGIEEETAITKNNLGNNSFAIYPNPSQSIISVTNAQNVAFIRIYDTAGKLVLSPATAENINITALAQGAYVVKIFAKGSGSTNKVLVKQ